MTASGDVLRWNWDHHAKQMGGVMASLGMMVLIISVTIQCYPLTLVSEISYLSSVKEEMESLRKYNMKLVANILPVHVAELSLLASPWLGRSLHFSPIISCNSFTETSDTSAPESSCE